MKNFTLFVTLLLLTLSTALYSQFPTQIGTRWEYFQYDEDIPDPFNVVNAFEDQVVMDTTIQSVDYHKVVRTGSLREENYFQPDSFNVIPLHGEWYYRVNGNQVYVLDSLVGTTIHESILYNFDLNLGDTLAFSPKDPVDLTNPETDYDREYMCANMSIPFCNDPIVVDSGSIQQLLPITGWNYAPHRNIVWRKGIGTVYSQDHLIVLSHSGQNYFLKMLSTPDTVLYQNTDLMLARETPAVERSFILYPQPARDLVTIQWTGVANAIRVVDPLGKVVQTLHPKMGELRKQLHLNGMEAGLYFVEIHTDAGRSAQRLIIQ